MLCLRLKCQSNYDIVHDSSNLHMSNLSERLNPQVRRIAKRALTSAAAIELFAACATGAVNPNPAPVPEAKSTATAISRNTPGTTEIYLTPTATDVQKVKPKDVLTCKPGDYDLDAQPEDRVVVFDTQKFPVILINKYSPTMHIANAEDPNADWVDVNPSKDEETGTIIYLQAGTKTAYNMKNGAYILCQPSENAAEAEIRSRINDLRKNYGKKEVRVITVSDKMGYTEQIYPTDVNNPQPKQHSWPTK